MLLRLASFFKGLWRRHIVDEFPFRDECFDCDYDDCEKCSVKIGAEKLKIPNPSKGINPITPASPPFFLGV